jgi:S-formylglutathione hydrolase
VKSTHLGILFLCLILLSACGPTSHPASVAQNTPTLNTPHALPASAAPLQTSQTDSLSGTASTDRSPTPTLTVPPLTAQIVEFPAPSLKGNLLGDPDVQTMLVVLPPSYDRSDLRYPVAYFLPGYGSAPSGVTDYYPLDQLAPLMASGELNEMILVVPNGANALGGAWYVNSPVTGNWADYILQDVVGYVDEHYRTIQAPEGRGIAGHSMGGFAALNLAMQHPDVFGAVYALAPGFFGEEGLAGYSYILGEKRVQNFLEAYQTIQSLPDDEALQQMKNYDGPFAQTLAYGTSFAPDPKLGPPYFDYPYSEKNGKIRPDNEIWARWEAGMGNFDQKIKDNKENLQKLRGIRIDYAEQDRLDFIPRGAEYVHKLLTEAGIPNELFHFPGDHADRIPERIRTIMLPFFSKVLAAPQ